MRLVLCALMTILLIPPGPATALDEQKPTENIVQLPPGTLNSAELFNLFRHKTVFAVTAVQKRESVSYYSPGGVVHQLRNGIKHTGRWRVTATGRICLQMENRPEKCRIVVKENGLYKKYIVRKNGKHQHSVSYPEFRDGNPLGI